MYVDMAVYKLLKKKKKYPGSVQDGSSLIACDLEPDDESDSWISDDEDPPGLSSHIDPHSSQIPLHRHYAHGFRQHGGFWDIYKYSTSSLLEPYNFNHLLVEACDALDDLRTSFEEPSEQILLHTKHVVSFIQSVLFTLESLSYSTLLDRTFETDPSGGLRHHFLMTLRSIVGCYYPAVFPTVSSQGAPGPHNRTGPAPSVEIYDYLTQSLCPMVEASTQVAEPPLEAAPVNPKSQDWWRCWTATRHTQMSVSDNIPGTA